jgi:hypothetical protein
LLTQDGGWHNAQSQRVILEFILAGAELSSSLTPWRCPAFVGQEAIRTESTDGINRRIRKNMLTAMRQTLCRFATCLLVAGLLTLTASAQLTSTPSSLSYGSVYLGTQSTAKSVTIKNTGTASVTINSISSSCPQYKLASGTTPFTLAAGKTTSYSMVLVPDVAQAFNCNETLAASGASNLVIPLTGTGLKSGANVTLSTTSLSFPNQKQGTSSANQSIILTNTGNVSVKINTISVTPGPFSGSGITVPFTLNAGATATLTVSYAPQFVQSDLGAIVFTFNQLANQVVDLSGNGIAPTAMVITNSPNLPQATVSGAYQVNLIAAKGTAPFTYSLKTGSVLPTGLTLSSPGVISGTIDPTVLPGKYTFTVSLQDSKSHNASRALTIGVSAATGSNCANISFNVPGTSTPMTAINDLGTGTYVTEEGGLYPSGSNVRPASHDADGVTFAQAIQPLDANGNPSPTGKYVMLALGESTALDEFGSGFLPIALHDPAVNANLVFVDGAQGGATPNLLASLTSPYWNTINNNYLPDQGVTAKQVVAVWIEDSNGVASGTFPSDMTNMQANYETDMNNLHTLFPNLTLVYFSSRIYAGYSNGVAKINPEPYAYESGFAVKNAIGDQINGASNLNYNPAIGAVKAPWMSWGPYYWGDGLLARKDGLVWTCQDLQKDGTHPSSAGELKVAGQILNFFKTDDTTKLWFLKP